MQTIYIDVYFLINFTVDLLSLHLASLFTKIKISQPGMIISAFFGGVYAVVLIFLEEKTITYLCVSLLFFFSVMYFSTRGCRLVRKIKFLAAFLLMEMLIGGIVYFLYGILERSANSRLLSEMESDRNLLILSLVVLLAIGVLKLVLLMFNNNFSEKSAKLKIVMFNKEFFIDALVDSGNFLRDPMDLSPVMLIKAEFSKKILPFEIPDVDNIESVSDTLKKRIRIIPATSLSDVKILCGLKPDAVFALKNKRYEKINLIIAFDKAEGSFAGFEALIPHSALNNL